MKNKNIYVKIPFHYGVHKFKIFKGHRVIPPKNQCMNK